MRWIAVLATGAIACGSGLAKSASFRSPPIIDSHVHLSYWPIGDQLPARGIAAVVDLAAPLSAVTSADSPDAPLRVIAAGPMLTRPDGYPLSSWGRDGYGIGCGDAACVTATVSRLAARGARVIKIAADDDGLAPPLIAVAVEAAHARGLKVAVHALRDDSVRRCGRAGADVLAHTPLEPLTDDAIDAWRGPGRAVISTLAAFTTTPDGPAIINLRRLRAAGVTVLYGTDLGNLREVGPSATEIALLKAAGLDDADIADAMTVVPATFWGIPLDGSLILDRDPQRDVGALLAPREVWMRGRRLR